MKRVTVVITALAMLATTGAASIETATVMLPLALLNKAHQAGSDIEAAEVIDHARAGMFDRDGGPTLRIGRTAYDLAATPEEKDALLAIALSHRIGMPTSSRSGAAKAGDALQNVIVGGLDANAGRNRAAAPRGDQTILRGVAWARAAGVCEKVSVALIDRLATGAPKGGPVASDARAAQKALGLLRFTPDERC